MGIEMNSQIPYNQYFDEVVVRVMDEVDRLIDHPLPEKFNLHRNRLPAHRIEKTNNKLQLCFWTDHVFYSFKRMTINYAQMNPDTAAQHELFTALIRENFANCPHVQIKNPKLTLANVG